MSWAGLGNAEEQTRSERGTRGGKLGGEVGWEAVKRGLEVQAGNGECSTAVVLHLLL